MRTQLVSKLLYLAVWLLISPGLLFAQQDSLPGSSLPTQGGLLVSPTPASSDTVITVTKLPYPEARIFPYERSEHPRLPSPAQRFGEGPLERVHERSELPHLQRLPSPQDLRRKPRSERGRGRGLDASTQDYESCIQQRHALQLEADLTTLKESKKGAWLKYLPSVSAGLAPAIRRSQDGSFNSGLSPTLSIGLNSSLIYQSHRDKQQRKAGKEAIIKQNQLQEATEIAQLRRLQRRLQTETDKLNLHSGVTDIDRQLFNLYQKQYDNHDISPEEYLLKRKAFLLQELRTQDQLNRIQVLQYQIEDLAGCIEISLDQEIFSKFFQPVGKR